MFQMKDPSKRRSMVVTTNTRGKPTMEIYRPPSMMSCKSAFLVYKLIVLILLLPCPLQAGLQTVDSYNISVCRTCLIPSLSTH